MSEKKRILLVDDEETITRTVQLFLEAGQRYEVRMVNDPRQALLQAVDFRPDLAILDVVMPHMDGGEVAAGLRAHPGLEELPVIFLTALVKEAELGRQGKTIGGYPFLAKPVEPDDLVALIEKTLGDG